MSKEYLIIDNGSYNIKAGFRGNLNPLKCNNALCKTKDGNIYTGDELLSQPNKYSGVLFKRPFDQGNLVSWETEKPLWDYAINLLSTEKEIDFSLTHLTLTEPPFQLPQLSLNTDQIVFEEYNFTEYYRCVPEALVPWSDKMNDKMKDFVLVIDVGFDSTWIVPVMYQNIYWKGIQRLPIGGLLLNNLLREVISFRHYDMTEEPVLVNTLKEKTCFVAEDFNKYLLKKKKHGCEFVLPDFKTTATGYVRDKKYDSNRFSDVQSLLLTDERFSVPESFFHPEVIFDNSSNTSRPVQSEHFKNIVDLAVDSIKACPEMAQPLLAANISLVGGSSQLQGFLERLAKGLREQLPQEWVLNITKSQYPADEVSWYGGAQFAQENVVNEVSVSRKEYFEHGSNWCQRRFGPKSL